MTWPSECSKNLALAALAESQERTVLTQGPLGCLLAKVAQGIQLIVLIACIVLSQNVSLALPGFYF